MLVPEQCYIPNKSELDEDGLGGNRDYMNLCGQTWDDVRAYLEDERHLIPMVTGISDEAAFRRRYFFETYWEEDRDVPATDQEIDDSVYEVFLDDAHALLLHLDVGTISAVCALSALRCVPFYSCNGGLGIERHHSDHPVIAFYARADRCDLLNAAATVAGLEIHSNGHAAVVETDEIDRFCNFAQALNELRKRFRPTRRPGKDSEERTRADESDQLRFEL
jgi:hypothetical protein